MDGRQTYICAEAHKEITLDDGRRHHLTLTERIEADPSPWPIPDFAEEIELSGEKFIDNWIETCKFPEDEPKNDPTRHDSANRIGGRHLEKSEVASKFRQFVLLKVGQFG